MAGLDPAISCQRQMRGSSPRMTYYKSVMAGLDPAISGQRQMRGSSPRMTVMDWGGGIFLLTAFLVSGSHSSPCSVKEALSGYRLLSVEKGPVPVGSRGLAAVDQGLSAMPARLRNIPKRVT